MTEAVEAIVSKSHAVLNPSVAGTVWFIPVEAAPGVSVVAPMRRDLPTPPAAESVAESPPRITLPEPSSVAFLLREVYGGREPAAGQVVALLSRIMTNAGGGGFKLFKTQFLWLLDSVFDSDGVRAPEAAELTVELLSKFDAVALRRLSRTHDWIFTQVHQRVAALRRPAFELARELTSKADDEKLELLQRLFATATRDDRLAAGPALAWARTRAGI